MTKPTVFLVDDDAAIRDALSLLLSLKGMRAQVFASAEAFLETYQPDWRGCLLTDLRMPGMSGLDLNQSLRQRGVSLPVIDNQPYFTVVDKTSDIDLAMSENGGA